MLIIVMSLSFLKTILEDLKHATSKGYNAWDVCEGKVTKSNLNVYASSIASKTAWIHGHPR